MTDYNDLEKLTKDVVRYTAPENGIAIFKSAPKKYHCIAGVCNPDE